MSEEFNKVLIKAYNQFKDEKQPPVPLKLIKSYLADEGINVDEDGHDG